MTDVGAVGIAGIQDRYRVTLVGLIEPDKTSTFEDSASEPAEESHRHKS
jgi:hypothetical protein